jgi:hypothetical protein
MIEDRQALQTSVERSLDEITDIVIDEAIKIHRDIGAGLLESVYEAVLARALERRAYTFCGRLLSSSCTTE